MSTIDLDTLRKRVAADDSIVVDVRPLRFFNGWRAGDDQRGGHIPDAVSYPVEWLDTVDAPELERLGLRGEGEQRLQARLARAVLDELHHAAPDALVLVRGPHAQAGQLALLLVRVGVQGDAGDGVPVDLEDVVVVELLLDRRRATAAAAPRSPPRPG